MGTTLSLVERLCHQKASMAAEDWRAKVGRKQKRDQAKLPKEWLLPGSVMDLLKQPLQDCPNKLVEMNIPRRSGLMTDSELSITEDYDVAQLLAAMSEGKFSALEVTTAFSKRAAIAGQLTSCLTETYFPEAQERAKALDKMKAEGRLAGPLHGLPVSLKDSFKIKGLEATIGFVSFIDRIAEQNSPLVDILLELGAVIYVKTNVPHTMMTADSHNHIFGRTLNPHKTTLTAGGSSGGEGALVAFRGSPIGVGTDIAGSIRIPSFCDGTYGFKPTTCRIPYGGQASPAPAGMDFFLACAGPLSNDLGALCLWMKAVIDASPAKYDSTALDVPWRGLDVLSKTKLRLGLLAEDPLYPLHPPVRRALTDATRLLQGQGHEIVSLDPTECRVADGCELGFAFFAAGGRDGGPLQESGEDPVPSVIKGGQAAGQIPKTLLADIQDLQGVKRLAALNVKRKLLQENWRKTWITHQLDAVIAPPAQHTAVPHDEFLLPAYTLFLNTLDVSRVSLKA